MALARKIRNIITTLVLVLGGAVVFSGEVGAVTCPPGSLREGEEVEYAMECNDEVESEPGGNSDSEGEGSGESETGSEDTNEGNEGDTGGTGDSSGDDEAEPCSSVSLTDDQVISLKELMEEAGYDVSNFKVNAVKIAASEINLCDGMSREEMRSLFNAMGITDLTDEELDANIEDFTKALEKVQKNETPPEDEAKEVEEVLETKPYVAGPTTPNTGVSTGNFNGTAIIISLGTIAAIVGGVIVARYLGKRQRNFNRVDFKK